MAQRAKAYAVSALRAVTYRIASTPPIQLPRCVAQLAASLWICRDVLSSPTEALKQDTDLSVIIHRYKTQLSTLLQDRTIEGRWSAIVLVKATIEAGGVEVLSKCNGWVRALLSILKKPDPPTTRSLAVLTLTRIFMLTWDYSNLVREITTPALPTFVSTCLSNAESPRCSDHELHSILEAFEVLISHHPTIFRSHEGMLRSFLLRLISSSASIDGMCYSTQHIASAQRLFVLLSFCAPKQGGIEKWDEGFQSTITAAHQTCDLIFAPVTEIWKSSIDVFRSHGCNKVSSARTSQDTIDAAGLQSWSGIFAGSERIKTLLDQIESFLSSASSGTLTIRISMLLDLSSRLCHVTVPGAGAQNSLQHNPQMPKEERDALFTNLPGIHARLLRLLTTAISRFGALMTPALATILELLVDVFEAESFDMQVRATAYGLLRILLERTGAVLDKAELSELTKLCTTCCNDSHEDAKSAPALPNNQINGDKHKLQTSDLMLQVGQARSSAPTRLLDVQDQALLLLPTLLSRLKADALPRRVRTQMDRTAILTCNKAALLASVLNPAPSPTGQGLQGSILPILARMFPADPEVEALVRPRLFSMYNSHAQDHVSTEEEQPMSVDEEGIDDDEEKEEEEEEAVIGPDVVAKQSDDTEASLDHGDAVLDAHSRSKHALEEDHASQQANKRLKEGPASSQSQSEWHTTLSTASIPDANHVTTMAKVNTVPTPQATSSSNAMQSDDESDFEMPPLTMEQDTDEEDE